MYEVLHYYLPKTEMSDILERLKLSSYAYFLVSCHREENVDSNVNFKKLIALLNALAEKFGQRIIVTTHPRARKRLEAIGIQLDKRVELHKPFGLTDYIKLELSAHATLSDSGTITEESSILNFPAVTIRQAHERPEGMDEGTLIMTGLKADRVLQSIDIVTSQYSISERQFRVAQDYNTRNVSKKVLRIILSYTDYVNRTVWSKP